MKLTTQEFKQARDWEDGYCSNCDSFASFSVESDAENCHCERCGENTVMGMEMALVSMHLEVSDERQNER